MSMVPESGWAQARCRHHDVPRFGALRGDNTPTPAYLSYINEVATITALLSSQGKEYTAAVGKVFSCFPEE